MKDGMSRRNVIAGTAAGVVAAALPVRADAPGLHEVEIRNFRYEPADLTVRPGDTIRWTNRDRAPHTATGIDKGWDSGRLGLNQSGEVTVTAEMETDYYCRIHPRMRAKLTIATA